MCGRYALHASPEVVALQFGLDAPPEFRTSYNVCPGTSVLTVRAGRDGRTADLNHWGLGGRLANARAETIDEKPAFREAFRRWRCLVPASGYYEWKTVAGRKHPWYMRPADGALFGLAGVRAFWNGQHTVSLITTAPNARVRTIHDRMPLIIAPEDYDAWLGAADPKPLLRPYAPERMHAHPVSTRVNRPENDDPSLIEEEAPPQRDLL
jgi:putative SOS response-associated peptidase YedK